MRKNTFVLLLALATAACGDCEEGTATKDEKAGPTDGVPPQTEGKERGNNNDASINHSGGDAGQSEGNDAGNGDNTARCAQLEAELGPEAAERGVSIGMLCNDPPPGTMESCAEWKQKCN